MLVEQLSSEDQELRLKIKDLDRSIREQQVERNKLSQICYLRGHVVLKKIKPDYTHGRWEEWGSAKCQICDRDLGWYCPDSPSGFCEYDKKEDPYHDNCIHCGLQRRESRVPYVIVKEGVSLMGTRGSWVLTRRNDWSPSMENAAVYTSWAAARTAVKVMKVLNFGAKIWVQKI